MVLVFIRSAVLVFLEDMLHVTVIALYRYVVLIHRQHLGVLLTRRRSVIVILFIMYVLPLLLVLIQFFTTSIKTDVYRCSGVVFNRYTMFCSLVRNSEFQHFGVVKKFGVVLLCAAVVGFSYARICFLVRRRGRRLIGIEGSFNYVRVHCELSLLKNVVVIFLTFAASYLPITFVYGLDNGRTLPQEVYFVAAMLLWLSPSVNWMVYGLMNAKFARAYRHLLCPGKTSTVSRQQRRSPAWPPTVPPPIKKPNAT